MTSRSVSTESNAHRAILSIPFRSWVVNNLLEGPWVLAGAPGGLRKGRGARQFEERVVR